MNSNLNKIYLIYHLLGNNNNNQVFKNLTTKIATTIMEIKITIKVMKIKTLIKDKILTTPRVRGVDFLDGENLNHLRLLKLQFLLIIITLVPLIQGILT